MSDNTRAAMTQIDELVKRLLNEDLSPSLFRKAAVALEAQATELTRLREQATIDMTMIQSLNREANALRERLAGLEKLCARLKLEAQIHSGEARAHKSTVHECYQAVSGATGELGNWNGARPVRFRIASLEATVRELRGALGNIETDARETQNSYNKNGPQWTSHNSEFYDASYVLDKCNEIADAAKAALATSDTVAREPSKEGDNNGVE